MAISACDKCGKNWIFNQETLESGGCIKEIGP